MQEKQNIENKDGRQILTKVSCRNMMENLDQ